MVERKILFNYYALDEYLEEKQKDLDRTDGDLTMLRNNCKNNLVSVLGNSQEVTIIINEITGDVTINGHDVKEKFYTLPTGYPMSNKSMLYHQIKSAMEEAKMRGIYDQIFREENS